MPMFGGRTPPAAQQTNSGQYGQLDQLGAVASSGLGQEVVHRGRGIFGQLQGLAGGLIASQVPGGKFVMDFALDHAADILRSDVPGGFSLGKEVEIKRSRMPGMEGFQMTSIPDGNQMFMGEDRSCLHCCCLWMGHGPAFHILGGNPLENRHLLILQSHRRFPCMNPEMDVVTSEGEFIGTAQDHSYCVCNASTTIAVRGTPVYYVESTWMDLICCRKEHNIYPAHGEQVVGTVSHSWSTGRMHIEFPSDARSSDKGALTAALMLYFLRTSLWG